MDKMNVQSSRFDRYLDAGCGGIKSGSNLSFFKSKTKCGCRLYVLLLIFLLVAVILGLLAALVFVQSQNDQNLQVFQLRAGAPVPQTTNQSVLIPLENQGAAILAKRVTEPIISANTLLTYLITKRKICLFEVSTLQAEDSRQDFEDEHIESAHLLYFNNLSHSGVPVHPLQFQRYIRNQGVDTDCHIIVYDKGEQIWSSYAFWIFKLFGHERTSLLDGGFPIWKNLQEHKMGPYTTARGSNQFPEYVGNFQAKWTAEYISAFDDVVTNFDNKEHDIVDAQSPEEYDGTAPGAIFGHIQGAINIPPEEIFNAVNNTWFEKIEMAQIFTEKGLQITRPVIVYCGTSLHASMIWLALHRLKFNATVYFGSWPEWVIRAPDYLKVTPEGLETLPSSTENLRTTPESVKMSSIVPKAANLPKNPQ